MTTSQHVDAKQEDDDDDGKEGDGVDAESADVCVLVAGQKPASLADRYLAYAGKKGAGQFERSTGRLH